MASPVHKIDIPRLVHVDKRTSKTDRRVTLREILDGLVEDGFMAPADYDRITNEQRSTPANEHPLAIVAAARVKSLKPPNRNLDIESLTEWMAGKVGVRYYHIDPLKIDMHGVTEVMSSDYASKRGILPVEVKGREVTIATAEPYITGWQRELGEMLRMNFTLVIANPIDINRYQGEFYNLSKSVKRAEKTGTGTHGVNNFEQLVELGRAGRTLDANDHHIVTIVDWLWQYAFDQRASDIHLEPRRELAFVRFRIDGVLHQVYQVPAAVAVAMTSRIKILARMDVVEKRRPQDGRIKTRMPDGEEIELRLSTMPTAHGEKLVMRIFDPSVLVRDFSQLGFGTDDNEKWQALIKNPGGIILVTGPTGSGKTTTLYSTLKQLATPEVNVSTIEDPIEMVEPAFNQMQVQPQIDLHFADGVRALMRQDPDIIMVGEIRDLETAEMAIQSALTGHLVLSTLHTNDAPTAVARLLDLGVPAYLITSTVLGVMAQRLVRTLCEHCKEKAPFTSEEQIRLWHQTVSPWKGEPPKEVYRPVGCLECRNTGYSGRVGIYEILLIDNHMKRLISDKSDLTAITEQAYKSGMKPLRLSGAMKVAQGITTMEEVLKVAPPST
ncbi:MAG: type II/IV secretion system protein [Betaproteobacteria bacterium]|nr:type II/IV secretion system protein [Betaproteobacteria bacterium]